MEPKSVVVIEDGDPCAHKGCKHHIKQPCEFCGRIGAKGEYTMDEDELGRIFIEAFKEVIKGGNY